MKAGVGSSIVWEISQVERRHKWIQRMDGSQDEWQISWLSCMRDFIYFEQRSNLFSW